MKDCEKMSNGEDDENECKMQYGNSYGLHLYIKVPRKHQKIIYTMQKGIFYLKKLLKSKLMNKGVVTGQGRW